MNTKAEAARKQEDQLDAPDDDESDDDGERILSQADWILEVESFWHHRKAIVVDGETFSIVHLFA